MSWLQQHPQLLAAAAIALLLFGAWLALRVRAWLESMRARGYNTRGQRGEREAERMLLARGYRITARQQRSSYEVFVNGGTERVALCFDFVVERNGEELIAEVKTGGAAQLSRAETRRQLLEYQLVTGCRCLLLVDPEAGRISEVAFPFDR